MTYILILMLSHSHSNYAVATQEFNSQRACEEAKQAVVTAWYPHTNMLSKAICVPKGRHDDR